ncbi:MAG: UPF0158 family protein [Anaerolineae bacterium]
MTQGEWNALGFREEALWWFDREEGRLVGLSSQAWEQAAQVGPESSPASEEVLLALRIRRDPARYLRIPLPPEQDLKDAREFVPTVLSAVVQRTLQGVLDGPRAMDRFRSLLARHPEELARWQAFRAARLKERIQEWLREQGSRYP